MSAALTTLGSQSPDISEASWTKQRKKRLISQKWSLKNILSVCLSVCLPYSISLSLSVSGSLFVSVCLSLFDCLSLIDLVFYVGACGFSFQVMMLIRMVSVGLLTLRRFRTRASHSSL